MAETAVAIDLVLENLEEFLGWPFSDVEKRHMGSLSEELGMLRSSLKDSDRNLYDEHGEVVNQMRDIVVEAADIIDWYRVSFMLQKKTLSEVLREIRSMEELVREELEWERGREWQEVADRRFGAVEGGSSSKTTNLYDEHGEVVNQMRDVVLEEANNCNSFSFMLLKKKLGNVWKGIWSIKKLVRKMCERERRQGRYGLYMLFSKLAYIRRELMDRRMCQEVELASLVVEMKSLRSFVEDAYKNWLQHQELLETIHSEIIHVMELIQSSSALRGHIAYGKPEDDDVAADDKDSFLYPHRPLSDVLRNVESIRKEVNEKIYQTKLHGIRVPQVQISTRGSSSAAAAASEVLVNEETMVGFESEVVALRQRLTASHRQRQVISIVGMAGSGKTTLARNLYNDPFIAYHFYIRGWTYVSQVYRKKDVLLGILSCVLGHKKETFYSMNEEKLGEELYKRLCGNRYLIVLDDMWDIRTWNDLKSYFPNDNNGSRIMFTTRITNVAMDAKPSSTPHHLRFLNEDESYDLFYRRVCVEESRHKELMTIGKQIALKCQGLPLAIVVVAGLLAKTEKTEDWWKKVADSLSSYVVTDQEQCMDILTLSYNNLPNHLKLFFLYLGSFPKEYEISARRLIWLWIAEGFVRSAEEKCLEEVAEDYLMELVDRNLVLVAKTRCAGGIRACRLHDLLHDLCLRKGMEEKFLQQIWRYNRIPSMTERDGAPHSLYNHSPTFDRLHILNVKKRRVVQVDEDEQSGSSSIPPPSSYLVPIGERQRRLCLHSGISDSICTNLYAPHVRSLLCCAYKDRDSSSPITNLSFIYGAFRLLRVLDLSAVDISQFPSQTFGLLLLRYLALKGKHLHLPSSIHELQNLETLILSHCLGLSIPPTIWKMARLRHLCIAGENCFEEYAFSSSDLKLDNLKKKLNNLRTLSQLNPSQRWQLALRKTPNLRKLGLCGRFESWNDAFEPPRLDFLNHLETLKLLNRHVPRGHTIDLYSVKFPPNLRRLTLSNTGVDWEAVSVVIGQLPNLEALKLEFQACVGGLWETRGGFSTTQILEIVLHEC